MSSRLFFEDNSRSGVATCWKRYVVKAETD